jgi:hypothetical protein
LKGAARWPPLHCMKTPDKSIEFAPCGAPDLADARQLKLAVGRGAKAGP